MSNNMLDKLLIITFVWVAVACGVAIIDDMFEISIQIQTKQTESAQTK